MSGAGKTREKAATGMKGSMSHFCREVITEKTIIRHQSRNHFLCKTNYLQYCTNYGILVLEHR